MAPKALAVFPVFLLLGCAREGAPPEGAPRAVKSGAGPTTTFAFEDLPAGSLPPGWRVEGTRPEGPPATWRVVEDATAPSKGQALALTAIDPDSATAYNLCWTDQVRFQNGTIEVAFKALAGEDDQGGGPLWRAKDASNYYVCRANPLEGNFRVYCVLDADRKQLASAKVDLAAGTWHTIRVAHNGSKIACWLDDTTLLEAEDASLPEPGGIGLWTKADAATSFDDLRISDTVTDR